MKCTQVRWLMMATAAIVSLIGAGSAFAVSVNPYSPTLTDIQSLVNGTDATNASSIDAIHVTSDGIHVDVTWRIGDPADPFNPQQDFPRIGLNLITGSENGGTGRLFSPPYDGVKWCLMSDQPVFAQPFINTLPNFVFYEPSNGGNNIAGDMSMQMSTLSFDDARNFNGLTPANIVHPDANGEIRAYAIGLQVVGPSVALGDAIPGHIWITPWVPEPSSAMLLMLGVVGFVGRVRGRRA
jgi:PEP-CTERM motif